MRPSRLLLMPAALAERRGSNFRLGRRRPGSMYFPLANFYDRPSVSYLPADRFACTATCRKIHAQRQKSPAPMMVPRTASKTPGPRGPRTCRNNATRVSQEVRCLSRAASLGIYVRTLVQLPERVPGFAAGPSSSYLTRCLRSAMGRGVIAALNRKRGSTVLTSHEFLGSTNL
ncbi:uncharacterized protein C8Q71DRAFT_349786 [Rhodofomes roseus]|uniref:Uncharacterized protein n=1 Tax=Rhodofomes roseus TaxID=34475 RepID=A0ABQ8KUX0_9APHY|nr:uncharacterized protein C8Q71DRAFT_349786 [Rhodofomes roseus]KAH9841828.1 hypothetical protein C8Q71DRAFT_349786 [Rhodofomes roseus]